MLAREGTSIEGDRTWIFNFGVFRYIRRISNHGITGVHRSRGNVRSSMWWFRDSVLSNPFVVVWLLSCRSYDTSRSHKVSRPWNIKFLDLLANSISSARIRAENRTCTPQAPTSGERISNEVRRGTTRIGKS